MSTAQLPFREPELLRASVVEAAMTLGPKVTRLMFADSISKHRREQGSSNGSSFDGFGGPFYDGYSASDSSSNISVIPESEENSIENFDSKTVLINDDFLGSHFPKNKEPVQGSNDNPSEQVNITPLKKRVKNFTFLSRKPVKKVEFSAQAKRPSISPPRRLFPALDDPVAPTFITPPKKLTSVSSRSDISNSPRATPTKLRKRINQVPSDDWDFKDPDRPSFFFDQVPELLKGSEIKSQDDVDDRGYLSEGTGLSYKHTSFRRKKKGVNPYIDWGEKLVSGNRSKSNLRQTPIPSDTPPAGPVSLPVADRFIRKAPPPETQTETKSQTPPEADVTSLNKLLVLPHKPPHQLTATPISDSSFIMMPDLNVAKRLHLDKYTSEVNKFDGVVGADNVIKLQMMEKLLKKKKDIQVLKEKPSSVPQPDQPVPEIQVILPSTTNQIDPIQVSDNISPIKTTQVPFPNRQETRSPIRGREPAFPTKPIRHNVPHSNLSPLRLRAPPERYRDIDVPRSVRSSYEKDLALEEEGTVSLPVRGRPTGGGSINSRSVYSER
ncbi:hypothetical protein Clacol_008369 [Clathrus columnatus]|uniref:Uncharacterized protein n=1 Tax=Clathrus columnatus TaxID=1419009 RepID=A0AAV5AKB3_9AGAM|nr:hypothetical protein Clacol_008369 [Clathrus columnatus]